MPKSRQMAFPGFYILKFSRGSMPPDHHSSLAPSVLEDTVRFLAGSAPDVRPARAGKAVVQGE